MKLLRFKNRFEGDIYPKDCCLLLGRCFGTRTGQFYSDGVYLKFTSPFVTSGKYVDLSSFTEKLGPVRNTYLFRIRKPLGAKFYKFTISKVSVEAYSRS